MSSAPCSALGEPNPRSTPNRNRQVPANPLTCEPARGRRRRAGRSSIAPKSSNISVGPYSSTAVLPVRFGDRGGPAHPWSELLLRSCCVLMQIRWLSQAISGHGAYIPELNGLIFVNNSLISERETPARGRCRPASRLFRRSSRSQRSIKVLWPAYPIQFVPLNRNWLKNRTF